jgi:hypothetical protein
MTTNDTTPAPIARRRLLAVAGAGAAALALPAAAAVPAVPAPSPETSIIPSLGMTFRQAADRVKWLLDQSTASAERDDNEDGPEGKRRLAMVHEWVRINDAIFATPAACLGDLAVKVERLVCPELGIIVFVPEEDRVEAMRRDVQFLKGRAAA